MNLKQFYKEYETFILFPDSLDELNILERDKRNEYTYLPMDSGQKYITGTITLSLNEKLEQKLEEMDFPTLIENIDLELKEVEKLIKKILKEQFVNKKDIRIKAKMIGACGLVMLQYYSEKTFMGIPIIEIE